MHIYSFADHSHWCNNAIPCEEAEIANIQAETVQYVRNQAKFKTTVSFVDGFTYVTFSTRRSSGVFQYTISVDKRAIAQAAIKAHTRAINKLKKKGYSVCATQAERSQFILEENNKILPNGGWRCSCGRVNQSFASSCVCGVKKYDIKSTQSENN